MRMPEWWYPYAIQMNPDTLIPNQIHLVTASLYIVLTFVYLIFLYRIRRNFISMGEWNQNLLGKTFFMINVGLMLQVISQIVLRGSLYITDGQYAIFSFTKSFLYPIGATMVFVLFPYCSLMIVNISKGVRKIGIQLIKFLTLIAVAGIFLTLGSSFNYIPEQEGAEIATILLSAVVVALGVIVLLLYRDSRNIPSKINKYRLYILILGLICYLFDFLSQTILIIGELTNNAFITIYWTFTTQAIVGVFIYLAVIYCLYLSFFFPLWLQKRLNVLPPSFTQLMEKRQILEHKGTLL